MTPPAEVKVEVGDLYPVDGWTAAVGRARTACRKAGRPLTDDDIRDILRGDVWAGLARHVILTTKRGSKNA